MLETGKSAKRKADNAPEIKPTRLKLRPFSNTRLLELLAGKTRGHVRKASVMYVRISGNEVIITEMTQILPHKPARITVCHNMHCTYNHRS